MIVHLKTVKSYDEWRLMEKQKNGPKCLHILLKEIEKKKKKKLNTVLYTNNMGDSVRVFPTFGERILWLAVPNTENVHLY